MDWTDIHRIFHPTNTQNRGLKLSACRTDSPLYPRMCSHLKTTGIQQYLPTLASGCASLRTAVRHPLWSLTYLFILSVLHFKRETLISVRMQSSCLFKMISRDLDFQFLKNKILCRKIQVSQRLGFFPLFLHRSVLCPNVICEG